MTPIVRLFYRKEDMDMVVTVDNMRQTERTQINVHLLK